MDSALEYPVTMNIVTDPEEVRRAHEAHDAYWGPMPEMTPEERAIQLARAEEYDRKHRLGKYAA